MYPECSTHPLRPLQPLHPGYPESVLLESRSARSGVAHRIDVLDRIKALALSPDGVHATTQDVADYYEVGLKTVEKLVERHRDELKANGLSVVRGSDLQSYQTDTLSVSSESEKSYPQRRSSLTLFSRRAVLNVGMLLRDSAVAQRVRGYLLDREGDRGTEERRYRPGEDAGPADGGQGASEAHEMRGALSELGSALRDLAPLIGRMSVRLDRMDRRLEEIDHRVVRVDQRLDRVDQRLDRVDDRLEGIDLRLDRVETRQEQTERRVARTEQLVGAMSHRLADVAQEVRGPSRGRGSEGPRHASRRRRRRE